MKSSLKAVLIIILLSAALSTPSEAASLRYRIRKKICDYNTDSVCPQSAGNTQDEGFALVFPPAISPTPSSIVSSENTYLTGLAAPTTAWLEAPAEATATFLLDGTLYAAGDAPVDITESSVVMLTATSPDTRGTSFTILFHLGDGTTATWLVSTLAEDGIMFASTPQTVAYTGFPYGYLVEAYSGNPAAILALEALDFPPWLTFIDNGDWTAQLSGSYPSVPFTLSPPTITTSAPIAAQEGMPYNYDFTADAGSTSAMLFPTLVQAPEWLHIQQTFGSDFNESGNFVISGIPQRNFVGTDAPTITTSAPTAAQHGRIYTYDFTANAGHADILLMANLVEAPEWLGIQQSFAHDFNEAGKLVIAGVPPTPPEANTAPTFTSSAPSSTVAIGSDFNYTASAEDDNTVDVVVMEATTLPAWLSFTYNGNWLRTGTLSGNNAPAGSHSVVLTIHDASGATATQIFTITVE